jgi:hypothetical protein
VTVAEEGAGGETRVSSSGFSIPYPPEYQYQASNTPLLEGMSGVSGGQSLTNPVDALRPVLRPGVSITDLWLRFLLFAALLLPLDIGVRRLALPVSEMWAKAIAFLRRQRQAEQTRTDERIARLRTAKRAQARPAEESVPDYALLQTRPVQPKEEPAPRPCASTGATFAASCREEEAFAG